MMVYVIVEGGKLMMEAERFPFPPGAVLACHEAPVGKSVVAVIQRVLEGQQIASCRFSDVGHRSRPLLRIAVD